MKIVKKIANYSAQKEELEKRMLEIDWWIIKNMRHPDFSKKSSERNVLSTRIDLLHHKINRLKCGLPEMEAPLKTYSYINPIK